jgi:hypothetical protein
VVAAAALAILGMLPVEAKATPPESMPVWRAQLAIRTADVNEAGTDDSVKAQLNGSNVSWLDYARDDFPRNDYFTYDLTLADVGNANGSPNVSRLSDVRRLEITKTGDDGLCIRELMLIVNGKPIYREVFDSPGLWLDSDQERSRTYTVSYSKLRQNANWRAYPAPVYPRDLPRLITRGEIESRIESIIGTVIHDNKLYWDHIYGRAVEVSKKDDGTLKVDLDLAAEVPGFNPEVDIDFDLGVSCSGGRISMTLSNYKVNVDSRWYAEVLTLGGYDAMDHILRAIIRGQLQSMTFAQETGQPFCPIIRIADSGDVHFDIPTLPGFRKRVTVTFLSVKVIDTLFPSEPVQIAFDFRVNNQSRRHPGTGVQTFALGQTITLPGLSFTELMDSGTQANLRLAVRTALKPNLRTDPRTGQILPSAPRQLELQHQFGPSINYGRGLHTAEQSTVNNGFFEITYRIDVQGAN